MRRGSPRGANGMPSGCDGAEASFPFFAETVINRSRRTLQKKKTFSPLALRNKMFILLLLCLLLLISTCIAAENGTAIEYFPIERLHIDWIYQDYGLKIADCFAIRGQKRTL